MNFNSFSRSNQPDNEETYQDLYFRLVRYRLFVSPSKEYSALPFGNRSIDKANDFGVNYHLD